MKRILVHEGGGAKGYISSFTLKKLEEQYGLLPSYYDLMTGTSTGAISTALLASGKVDAKTINSIYPNLVKRVFQTWLIPVRIPKYTRKNFIDIFEQIVGVGFEMRQCETKLTLTSVDLTDNMTHFFKSWEEQDGKEKLIDCVMRSALSAPYYFNAINDPIHKCVWTDGGVGYYNLNLDNILVEAILQDWLKEGIQIDIIGCGFSNNVIPYDTVEHWGVAKELGDFFNFGNGGLARSVAKKDQIRKMKALATCRNIQYRYWDVEIDKKYDTLDGVKFIKEYAEFGKQMAEKPLESNF